MKKHYTARKNGGVFPLKYANITSLPFVCRHFFPGNINPIWDELLADFYWLLCATGKYDTSLALKFLGIEGGKYISGRLESYVEGQITQELVGDIVGLTELLTGLVPEKFSKEEDNFSTVISIQNHSIEFLK